MRSKAIRRAGLLSLLLAVAACQTPTPTNVADESLVPLPRTGAAAKPAPDTTLLDAGLQTGVQKLAANQFQVLDPAGAPVAGAEVEVGDQLLKTDAAGVVEVAAEAPKEPGYLPAVVKAPGMVTTRVKLIPGFAVKLHALDPKVHQVSAATGGRFENSDGTMSVTFSPGALDRDAAVHLTRIYAANPASLKALSPAMDSVNIADLGDEMLGAYTYALELGDAQIRPGASIRVNFLAEAPLQAGLEAMLRIAPDGMKDSEFARDEQGRFLFAMMVPAPPEEPAFVGPAASMLKLMSRVCNRPNDPETYYYSVCNRVRPVRCDQQPNGIQVHDWRINNGHCVYVHGANCGSWTFQQCSTQSGTRYHQSSTINAYVTYNSDDSRYSGRAVSGARVSFSHVGTPVRAATSLAYTSSSGYANGIGREGASGVASASTPGDAGSYGTSASYSVNCGVVNLSIVKKMPRVTFAYNNQGAALGGSYTFSTSHGAQALSGFASQVKAIAMKSATAASEAFSIAGGNQALGSGQIDYDGASGQIGWNRSDTFTVKTWHNSQISATASYASNDNTVPADQQPPTKWAGQAANGVNFNFAHRVSGSPNKPAGRDVLSFNNVNAATAWGLNGDSSTVTATRTSNGITLTGTANGNVGGSVGVSIPARLPACTFEVSGTLGTNYVMNYSLTDAAGVSRNLEMKLPGSANIQFRLPVEEAVGNAGVHTFRIVNIISDDGNHSLVMPDGSFNYPVMSVQRGREDYSLSLKSELIAAK